MATPLKFVETLAVGTANTALASVPTGADNAIIRSEVATMRWSESTGTMLSGSTGIPLNPGDSPFRITNLAAFRVTGIALNTGVLQVAYYQGFYVL